MRSLCPGLVADPILDKIYLVTDDRPEQFRTAIHYGENIDMTSVASGVQLSVTPLTGTTGAEIREVNLREQLDPATVDEIRRALVEYKVIFFPVST